MKYPAAGIIIVVNDHFIYNVKIAYRKVLKPAEHFIMVAGDIIYFNTAAKHTGYLFNYLHMARRPVFFTKLPDVDDIAV
jgi:hypothetical protein